MTSFYIKDHNGLHASFQTTSLISKSSNGEIYSIKPSLTSELKDLVLKKLSRTSHSIDLQPKIEYMVAHQPQAIITNHSKICWPAHCVYDENDVFVGYLMPLALDDSLPLDEVLNNGQQHNTKWQVFEQNTADSYELRLKTCINICQTIRSINETNRYLFTELSPTNIMVTNNGRISLINCESIIEGNHEIHKLTRSDSKGISGYTPPEALGINISTNIHNESQEEFPLSVIIYKIIFRIHPYSAIFNPPYAHLVTIDEKVENNLFVHGRGRNHISSLPPEHLAFDHINHKLKSLFHLAFDIKSKDRRPTPQLWENTLTLLANERSHGLQPQPNLNTTTSQPDIAHQNTSNETNVSPVHINTNDTGNPNGLNRNVKASWWGQGQSKLAIIIFLLLIGVIVIMLINNFDSRPENAAEDLYEAQQEVSSSETYWNERDSEHTIIDDEVEDINPPKLTDQLLYVISDRANLRQRPSLDSRVVMKLEYNTELTQTDSPLIQDGGITWINVASNGGTRGWMSSLILSKYPRDILYSRCGVRNNEVEYIVASAGVNIRNAANTNDNSVIGVIQKGEIVCPYMYIGTYDESIGRWMGFQLTSGGVAWVAESLLERYYEPEPTPIPEPTREREPESEPEREPEPEHLDNHEPNASSSESSESNKSDYDKYNSWF